MIDRIADWSRPLARRVLSQFRPQRDVRIEPFDAMFPDVEKTVLLDSTTVDTPELASATVVPGVSEYQQPTYRTPAVFAAVLHDVLYCPVNNVVLTADGRVLGDSLSTIRRPEYLDHYALSASSVIHIDGPATPFRSRFNHYYHTLIDHAPRLFLLSDPFFESFGSIDLLLRDGPTPLEALLLSRLAPSSVHPLPLKRRCLYHVDTFLFTSFLTNRHAAYLPPAYKTYFQDRMLPKRPRRSSQRIYISRAGNEKGRCVLNEDAVLDVLRPLGFEAYQLQNLSYEEQIDLFYDAEVVVGPHGAGFSNLIYAEDALVIEWFPSPHLVPSFYFLSKSLGHTYVHCHRDGAWRDDDLTVDLDELRFLLQHHQIS